MTMEGEPLSVKAERGGRQLSVFMSENLVCMVDLFDQAGTEGARYSVLKQDRKVTTRH